MRNSPGENWDSRETEKFTVYLPPLLRKLIKNETQIGNYGTESNTINWLILKGLAQLTHGRRQQKLWRKEHPRRKFDGKPGESFIYFDEAVELSNKERVKLVTKIRRLVKLDGPEEQLISHEGYIVKVLIAVRPHDDHPGWLSVSQV